MTLSCGTLTVDTTAPGVSAAQIAVAAPTGYQKTTSTSSGATPAALGFRGSLANINTLLPWISYSWISACGVTAPVFQAAIWDAQDADNPIAWNFGENGHYYQFIPTAVSWDAAYQAITGQSANWTASDAGDQTALPTATRSMNGISSPACRYQVFGMCGYFATVSSKAENDFIYSKSAQKGVWLGGNGRCAARAACANRGFYWVDPVAPEYGVLFSTGKTGVATAGNYANWNPNEPNGSDSSSSLPGETALQIMGGVGQYNDLWEYASRPPSGDPSVLSNWNQYAVLGYVVEYGGSTAAGEAPTGGGSSTQSIEWHY
jgi:hypothetical protein